MPKPVDLFEFKHDDRFTPTQNLTQRIEGQMEALRFLNPEKAKHFQLLLDNTPSQEGRTELLGRIERAVSAGLKPASKRPAQKRPAKKGPKR